jgi:hemolysin TlyA family protein
MSKKMRADQMLVERGLVQSRSRAQAVILAGLAYSGDRRIEKAGDQLLLDAPLALKGKDHPWVSRGGVKLAHALKVLGWDVAGVVAMDVGSSTGGFTDVLLTNGAAKVYAIDVGTNQLAWKLRQDERVIVHEQTNARDLTPNHVPEAVDVIVCDASFIGLAKVLSVPLQFATGAGRLIALIKPQFEAGAAEVGKGGVVRDPVVHQRVCDEVHNWIQGAGWSVEMVMESPIKGPEGNIEFLIAARKQTIAAVEDSTETP